MLRFARRALYSAAFAALVPLACTSFGAEPSEAPDASPPQPTATALPTSPPGLPDADLPDGLAPGDVATPPTRDADAPDAATARSCTGNLLFATNFEGASFPPAPFTNAGTIVPQFGPSLGFDGNTVTFRLPAGMASQSMLSAAAALRAGTQAVCVEGKVMLTATSPTVMGAEVDVMRVTVGGVTARVAFSSLGTFLAVGGPSSVKPFAISNPDRPHHWVMRLGSTKAELSIDGVPYDLPIVSAAPFAQVTFQVGLDATRVTTPAAVQASSVTVDDLNATSLP